MRSLVLAACLLSAASFASALPCSESWSAPFWPCTPDPSKETTDAKQKILELIALAQKAEPIVKGLEAEYRAARDNKNASTEKKLEACEPYVRAKREQDNLYKRAMSLTWDLYRLERTINARSITIGEPDEAALSYLTGLAARWDPQVTDSGPGVKLAVRVKGSDGLYHYGGLANMDPLNPNQLSKSVGLTLPDGRVLILKDLFKATLDQKNPGLLGSVLYHEVRHFNRLSWKDKSGKNRSWASPEEEERDAYDHEAYLAHIFGLSDDQKKELKELWLANDQAVKSGTLTSRVDDPIEQERWRKYYEGDGVVGQINLEDEYAALQEALLAPLREQREQAERQRLAREERERQAEEERLAREQAKLAVWQDIHAAAAVCGYAPRYQRYSGKFMGYDAQNELLFFRAPVKSPMTPNDYRIGFLVARACYEAVHNPERASPRACNGAATLLRSFAAKSDFAARLDDIFGARDRRCINHVFDPANKITDTASFDKVIANYHKQLIKEQREYDKIWRSNPPRSDDGNRGGERPPRDNNRTPSDPDHDEVWRRINPIIPR